MIEKCNRLIYGLEMISRAGEPVKSCIVLTQKRFWKHPVGGQRMRRRISCVRKTAGRLFPGLIASSVSIVTKCINTPCSASGKLCSLHRLHSL